MGVRADVDRHRFRVLDSLRGVCACFVALLHFNTTGAISGSAFIRHSFLFVDFFFVLSGFVIAASYQAKLRDGYSPAKFMFLRWGRLYPLHAAILLLFVAFELTLMSFPALAPRPAFTGAYDPAQLLWSFLLVQPFIGKDALYWNSPSWSIATEFWTYLIFAMIFYMKRANAIAITVCIFALLYLISFSGDRGLNNTHDYALARCLVGFSIGVVVFALRSHVTIRSSHRLLEIVSVVAVGLSVSLVKGLDELIVPFLFGWCVFLFSYERGPVSLLLSQRPFVLVGTLSYSIYMVHCFIALRMANVLSRFFPGTSIETPAGKFVAGWSTLSGDLLSLVFLATVICAAGVTYWLIEFPARAWSRRLVQKSGAAKPLSAASVASS